MECMGHLRWVGSACQCPSGNKRFHIDLLKQRQVGGGNAAGDRELQADIREGFHAGEIRLAPLLAAGLCVAPTVINGLCDPDTVPFTRIIQRPVTKQLHLNFPAVAQSHLVTLLDGCQRRGADDGHPVRACAKCLFSQRFSGIGHFPVSHDRFSDTAGAVRARH